MTNESLEILVPQNQLPVLAKAIQEGLEVSIGARATSTHDHSKDEQVTTARAKVVELRNLDKTLPLLLASMKGSSKFFRQEALRYELEGGAFNGTCNILRSDDWFETYQKNVVENLLYSLDITYILRLYISFIGQVNNRRTNTMFLRYIYGQGPVQWIKYRTKINRILRYIYGKKKYAKLIGIAETLKTPTVLMATADRDLFDKEVMKYSDNSTDLMVDLLLFANRKLKGSDQELLKDYFKMFTTSDRKTFFKLAANFDKTMIMGIISSGNNPLFDSFYKEEDGKKVLRDIVKKEVMKSNKVTSDEKKLRETRKRKSLGLKSTSVSASKVSAEALYKTEMAGATDKKVKQAKKAKIKANKIDLPYNKIGIILDTSLSSAGGRDSQNTILALSKYVKDVLKASVKKATVEKTQGSNTNLCEAYVNLMIESGGDIDALFVVSDGYENAPYEGALNDLLGVTFDKLGRMFPVIHCNPIVSAEMKASTRKLGAEVVTMAITDPVQIESQMNSHLLLLDTRAYLKKEYSKLLNLN